MAKRIFDLFFSTIGLLVLGPILMVVALIIKRGDNGPVFYRGVRIGLNGQPFRIFKFRSMVINAEKIGASSTSDDDARITAIGKILRKYKLDELPQLINVFFGDMSFVGPRPEVSKFVEMYTAEEKQLLSLKPGITDWASLWNCDEGKILAGHPDPDKGYLELIRPRKIQLQLKYLRENSILVDFKIILFTVLKLSLKGVGIVWDPVSFD